MNDQQLPLSATDFGQVLNAVSIACQILQHYDLEGLYALMSDRDGMLCFRDPTLFQQVRADPHWQAKTGLVKAAADFTHAVRAIKTDLAEKSRKEQQA